MIRGNRNAMVAVRRHLVALLRTTFEPQLAHLTRHTMPAPLFDALEPLVVHLEATVDAVRSFTVSGETNFSSGLR